MPIIFPQIGGQEHFYLETNASLAVPGEGGSMEVFASTQNPSKTQELCAKVCGVDRNKVGRHLFVSAAAAAAAAALRRLMITCFMLIFVGL